MMKLISTRFGALIAESVIGWPLPASFLAALIANESSGDPNAKRFESTHFSEILLVMAGQQPVFDKTGLSRVLGRDDLARWITPDPKFGVTLTFQASLARAIQLATSWGLTQIMGWNFLEFDRTNWLTPDPGQQLQMTMTLLSYRANKWHLNMAADFEKLFASWNAWVPDPTKTTDPKYCEKGLLRMRLYEAIRPLNTPASPGTIQ